ncbi:MAG: hypothetical protein KDJ74_02615 [Notoacmeibacter sp.]|nr:hypothetical protein [Notoacmeibacter sp.]
MNTMMNRRAVLGFVTGLAALLALPASATSPQAPKSPEWVARFVKGDDGKWLLEVTGEYWTNTLGWKVWLEEGIMTRSQPPTLIIRLMKEAPTGPVGQALDLHKVALRLPALPSYRAVRVLDGETPLAQFKDLIRPES